MNRSATENALRPLGVGEVLDRAVNLCVRYFVPLALIFLAYAVPLAVVQYYASEDFVRVMQAFSQSMAPHAGRPPDPQALSRVLATVHPNGWFGALTALTFFIAPFPTAALISATTQAYLGRSTSFTLAYRAALGRWLPLVGVNVVYLLAFVVVYVVLFLMLLLVGIVISLMTVAMHGVGIALGIVVGLCTAVAMLAFFVVAALAFQVSYFTCVVEGADVRRSVGLGVSRVFGGVGLRRSLLIGVVFVTIAFGIALVSGLGEALIANVLHNAIAGTVYATLVRLATAAFTTAFIGIFYVDLRVREEGFDLQLAAQRTELAPPPPA